MNEQEKAQILSTQIDQLLQRSAPLMVDDFNDNEDQSLLDVARILAAQDFSAHSYFLRHIQQPQGDKPMLRIFAGRHAWTAVVALVLLLLFATLTLTPVGVMAQELWQSLFVHHDSNSMPMQETAVISAEPTGTPIPVAEVVPNLTISEVDALAPFAVQEPAAIPTGYKLASVYYDEALQRVTLLYLSGNLGISLHQEPTALAPVWLIGPEANIEAVMIGDVLGEYVRGSWVDVEQNNGTTITVEERVWDSADQYQQLRWTADDVTYTLGTTVGQDIGLTQADLIAIAASMQ